MIEVSRGQQILAEVNRGHLMSAEVTEEKVMENRKMADVNSTHESEGKVTKFDFLYFNRNPWYAISRQTRILLIENAVKATTFT